MEGWWIFALGLLLLVLIVTYVLHYYADFRQVGWVAFGLVWIGLFLNFFLYLLLPIDVAAVRHRNCISEGLLNPSLPPCPPPLVLIDYNVLVVLWKIVYWSLFILCWTALPIWQSYCEVGQFTFWSKMKAAIRENIIFYAVALAIGIVLFVFVIATNKIHLNQIFSLSIGAANAWGLLLMMCFLGYALVEIPKYTWLHSNDSKTLDIHQFHAVSYRDKHLKQRIQLEQIFKQIKQYSVAIDGNDPYRPYIDEIIDKCPIEYRDIRQGSGDNYPTFDKLVQLNVKLKQTVHKVKASRSVYVNLIERAFNLEDRIASYQSVDRRVRWTFHDRKNHQLASLLETLEWIWFTYLHSITLQIATFICVCMALMIVWSETFSRKFNVDLSIFSQVFNSRLDYSWIIQWLFMTFPLVYIATCSYWTLFRLKLFNYYQLIPHHHSSGSSLLFCAIYVSRLTPTIAYNFLMMLDGYGKDNAFIASETAYYQVLQPEQVSGGIIEAFNTHFPVILILLCLGSMFDVYTKIVMSLCAQRFRKYVYHEDFSSTQVAEGQSLIQEERTRKQRNEVYSVDELGFGKKTTRSSKANTKIGEQTRLNNPDLVENIKKKWIKNAEIPPNENEEEEKIEIQIDPTRKEVSSLFKGDDL